LVAGMEPATDPRGAAVRFTHWRIGAIGQQRMPFSVRGDEALSLDEFSLLDDGMNDLVRLENMNAMEFYAQIGDARIGIQVRRGKPPIVLVERGEYGPECSPETVAAERKAKRRKGT
jgi:hypothetical protein